MKPDINTCFVISPISEEGSPIRAEADRLLWVITNISEKHGFKAIRVDKVAGSTVITDEIKSFIANSGLCICILTDSNPNVFYETGLRHSTKKPYIHLMRKGNDIPFDVKGINTIFYGELDSFDEMKSLNERLDAFFTVEKGKVSEEEEEDKLDTILDALKGLSEKIDRAKGTSQSKTSDVLDFHFDRNPEESFLLSIAEGDLETAESVFPTILKKVPGIRGKLASAQRLAQIGGRSAIEFILEHYSEDPEITEEETISLLSAAVEGVSRHCHEKGDDVLALLDSLSEKYKTNKPLIVQIKNQKQKTLFALRRYEEAMEIAEDVLSESPQEAAFLFNASLIYEKLGLKNKALEVIEKLIALDTGEPLHISQAIDIYLLCEMSEKARDMFERLKTIDARSAAIKALDHDFRKAIGLTRRER